MCKENTVGYIPTLKDRVTAALLRFFNPGYSYCSKCGKPWNHCKSKAVMTSPTGGTFATCQKCWDNSTLDQLKVYYTDTYHKQERMATDANEKLNHSLEHLLECVEKEYYRTRKLGLQWRLYDHDYEKKVQDIWLRSGEIFLKYYPNAGKWSSLRKGQPDNIDDSEVLYVRLHNDPEFNEEAE